LLETSFSVLVGTFDNIPATLSGSAANIVYLPAGTGAVATTVQAKERERVSVLDFFANGVSGVAVDPTGIIRSDLGIQAALVYSFANAKDLTGPSGAIYKVSDTIIIPQYFDFTSRGITVDFCNAEFYLTSDFTLFTSGYLDAGVLTSSFGTPEGLHGNGGITFGGFHVKSTIGDLVQPLLKIQDWHQNCEIKDIQSFYSQQLIWSANNFYCYFTNLLSQLEINKAGARFVFSGQHNLNKMNRLQAGNAVVGYRFDGPVTALQMTNISFEGQTVGVQFNATVYDAVIENSYVEGVSDVVCAFDNVTSAVTLRNNYVNFLSDPNMYLVRYLPGPSNNIIIEADNTFVSMPSNSNIIKNREDVYGSGIIIKLFKSAGNYINTLVDNTVFGRNITVDQKITLNAVAIANVINVHIPGNYSGAFSSSFASLATGFANNSVTTSLILNTKIAWSFTMRVAVALNVEINGANTFVFGEFRPTGYNSFTFFASTGASFAPSVIINATNVGGFVQINGTAGVNGLGTANNITTATGEVRVV